MQTPNILFWVLFVFPQCKHTNVSLVNKVFYIYIKMNY